MTRAEAAELVARRAAELTADQRQSLSDSLACLAIPVAEFEAGVVEHDRNPELKRAALRIAGVAA
jgi:hypothetical protein